MFISCITNPDPFTTLSPTSYFVLFYILFSLTFPSLSSAAVPAGHKVCVHPGLLVWCVYLDWEKVSPSRSSCCLKTGSGDLLHAAPAQTCLGHPQPGGHRVPGYAFHCYITPLQILLLHTWDYCQTEHLIISVHPNRYDLWNSQRWRSRRFCPQQQKEENSPFTSDSTQLGTVWLNLNFSSPGV